MRWSRLWLFGLLLIVATSTGCCRFAERWCQDDYRCRPSYDQYCCPPPSSCYAPQNSGCLPAQCVPTSCGQAPPPADNFGGGRGYEP